jgi:LysM repeat protein
VGEIMRKLSYLLIWLVCTLAWGANIDAKTGQVGVPEGKEVIIKSKTDSQEIESKQGPGILSYYYLELDSQTPANPPDGYEEIPMPDGGDLVIEEPKNRGSTKIDLNTQKFYYQFISCKFFSLGDGDSCIIRGPDEGTNIIEGPSQVYYIQVSDANSDQFRRLDGYEEKQAGSGKTMIVACAIDGKPELLEGVVALQYSLPGVASLQQQTPEKPAKKPTRRPPQSNTILTHAQAGETLADIAKRCDTQTGAIKNANPSLIEPLRTGVQINIPIKNLPSEYQDKEQFPHSSEATDIATEKLELLLEKRVDWIAGTPPKRSIVTRRKTGFNANRPMILIFDSSQKKGDVAISFKFHELHQDKLRIMALDSERKLLAVASGTEESKDEKVINLRSVSGFYYLFFWYTAKSAETINIKELTTTHTSQMTTDAGSTHNLRKIPFQAGQNSQTLKGQKSDLSRLEPYTLYTLEISSPGTLTLSDLKPANLRAQLKADNGATAFDTPPFEIETPGIYRLKIDLPKVVSKKDLQNLTFTLTALFEPKQWEVENADLITVGEGPPY